MLFKFCDCTAVFKPTPFQTWLGGRNIFSPGAGFNPRSSGHTQKRKRPLSRGLHCVFQKTYPFPYFQIGRRKWRRRIWIRGVPLLTTTTTTTAITTTTTATTSTTTTTSPTPTWCPRAIPFSWTTTSQLNKNLPIYFSAFSPPKPSIERVWDKSYQQQQQHLQQLFCYHNIINNNNIKSTQQKALLTCIFTFVSILSVQCSFSNDDKKCNDQFSLNQFSYQDITRFKGLNVVEFCVVYISMRWCTF